MFPCSTDENAVMDRFRQFMSPGCPLRVWELFVPKTANNKLVDRLTGTDAESAWTWTSALRATIEAPPSLRPDTYRLMNALGSREYSCVWAYVCACERTVGVSVSLQGKKIFSNFVRWRLKSNEQVHVSKFQVNPKKVKHGSPNFNCHFKPVQQLFVSS